MKNLLLNLGFLVSLFALISLGFCPSSKKVDQEKAARAAAVDQAGLDTAGNAIPAALRQLDGCTDPDSALQVLYDFDKRLPGALSVEATNTINETILKTGIPGLVRGIFLKYPDKGTDVTKVLFANLCSDNGGYLRDCEFRFGRAFRPLSEEESKIILSGIVKSILGSQGNLLELSELIDYNIPAGLHRHDGCRYFAQSCRWLYEQEDGIDKAVIVALERARLYEIAGMLQSGDSEMFALRDLGQKYDKLKGQDAFFKLLYSKSYEKEVPDYCRKSVGRFLIENCNHYDNRLNLRIGNLLLSGSNEKL